MEVLGGGQGASCRRNTASDSGNDLMETAQEVPVLKGLEEQEEEEQLFPVLPVFLLRWAWLWELSFLDFPSPSLLPW